MEKKLVVFTYAPAGLGHIRVTNALMAGLSPEYTKAVFAPVDKRVESMHRFSSVHIYARRVMEYFQRGKPQELYTNYYRHYLKTHASHLIEPFVALVKSQKETYEEIVIVSTHFDLAFQLGAIKAEIEQALNAKITLVVQVTDDSPQHLWYVDVADIIVCPSERTKEELGGYGKRANLAEVKIMVVPYPVIPLFAVKLPPAKLIDRADQYDPQKSNPINIVIPVSGAAVGMKFFTHIMERLHKKSDRFIFHIVCRKAPFTLEFLRSVRKKDYVRLHVSGSYSEIVRLYNDVYKNNVISAEITKPSEQAFKVLLTNDSVGGSYIFFCEPVGRQEYDNLDFLDSKGFLTESSNSLRGWILPNGSNHSAKLIWDLYNSGRMLKTFKDFTPKEGDPEVSDLGAFLFWEAIGLNRT